eukprot:Protomagalhaensia_sp_Gyna_25__3926@NODE_352_length_3764_cov_606_602148_g271_i0_p1_GENE_NODE_352_length_3764_cov_606_602148_g271_i0NODE_352_length_3764_cov_606_602148_g271_i0_p1_ORF_typecomplete_len352_score59_40SAM_decarbox/PF01536_16/2e50_NODE_352_length_3764_cov_606_602148_g271_i018642919
MTSTPGVDFEGVEKRLLVEATGVAFLEFTEESWRPVLDAAQCSVLSWREEANRKIFLLSESTLFVWETGFLLKTCGRTSPLKGFATLLSSLPHLQNQLVWVAFSRLDFLHPEQQFWPHQNFEQEIAFTQACLPNVQHLTVPAGRHNCHLLFYADPHRVATPRVFEESLLIGIRPDSVAALTGIAEADVPEGRDPVASRALDNSLGLLRPSFSRSSGVLDEFWFQPQGYSCNALTQSDYFSCHISPEPRTSYASLELGHAGLHRSEEDEGWLLRTFEQAFAANEIQRTRLTILPAGEAAAFSNSAQAKRLGNETGGGMCCIFSHSGAPTAWSHCKEAAAAFLNNKILEECHA